MLVLVRSASYEDSGGSMLDWLQSLKQFFINASYHILVAGLYSDGPVLKQGHQSKTGYKYYDMTH